MGVWESLLLGWLFCVGTEKIFAHHLCSHKVSYYRVATRLKQSEGAEMSATTDTVSDKTWSAIAATMVKRLAEKGILGEVIGLMTPEERADFNRWVAQTIG